MIKQIKKDLNEVFDKYKDKLWCVKVSGCSYGDPYEYDAKRYDWSKENIYIGSKEDVTKVISLQYLSYKIEPFDLEKHTFGEMIDAQQEYKELFVPKMSGDTVEYQGQECRVSGFSGTDIWINLNEESILLKGKEKKNLKLLYSKYWSENKKV